ncbi:hypothetical protein [Solirubrobacter soli]|uniref:hypothetical protein n=1 Tax=Solirubrobacter soli TaxID=363832 RepID=UPI00041A7D5A|nr:hypothetical protein [Solirubrobacter soli]
MKIVSLLVAVTAAASLVACGAEEDPSKPASAQTQEAKNRKAMLDFAKCMRSNGVDMPDPQFNGGRVTQRMKGDPKNPEKVQQAEKACDKYRAQIKAPEMSAEQKEEFKKAALANARCMREHGIDNFPDPQFDSNGGARVRIDKSMNPEGAKFQAAQKACEKTMPDGPSTSSAGEDEN